MKTQTYTTAIIAGCLMSLAAGCATTYPRGDVTGEMFPTVSGQSLAKTTVTLPKDLTGKPAVLLIGYKMITQFDIDRWLLGMQQAGVEAPAYEVPTIKGMAPGLFAGQINSGMRKGIPKSDWAGVITVYGDADKVVKFLGNENDTPARVVLLDSGGKVVYFHDSGYDTNAVLALKEAADKLKK